MTIPSLSTPSTWSQSDIRTKIAYFLGALTGLHVQPIHASSNNYTATTQSELYVTFVLVFLFGILYDFLISRFATGLPTQFYGNYCYPHAFYV